MDTTNKSSKDVNTSSIVKLLLFFSIALNLFFIFDFSKLNGKFNFSKSNLSLFRATGNAPKNNDLRNDIKLTSSRILQEKSANTHSVYKFWTVPHDREPRKILIDLGANEGDRVVHFLEKPDATFHDGASSLLGCCGDGSWEVVVFEANPAFNDILNSKKQYYEGNKIVKKFHLYSGTAIGTKSGQVTFVLDNNDNSYSSTIATNTKNYAGKDGMGERRIQVPVVGIVDLFRDLSILPKDEVILKVDVEGFEYELLRHVFATGLHELIDQLAVEYHHAGIIPEQDSTYKCYEGTFKWIAEDVPGMRQVEWH